jgi:3D (Asp-Asp-Asp) domain-containing protein
LNFYSQTLVAENRPDAAQNSPAQVANANSTVAIVAHESGLIMTAVLPVIAFAGISRDEAEPANTAVAVTVAAPSAGSVEPPQRFTATAYALSGRTASGHPVRRGFIAADHSLPLGTRVRLDAGRYSGEYVVADRGSRVRGRIIDIWVPSNGEAIRFGRRPVKLTVLSYGAKKARRAAKTR